MNIVFVMDEEQIYIDRSKYTATCKVRNELNGKRPFDQVVKNTPADGSAPRPYMPRMFPTGRWRVKLPIRTNPKDYQTYGPWKIPTTAKRNVALWKVEDGVYTEPSGETSKDGFYHLHASPGYTTTLGCIRLSSEADAIEIAHLVRKAIGKGEKVWLEVVATR